MWKSILAIAVGSALGALLRWQLGIKLNALFPTIPPGTLAANLIGAYVIGTVMAFPGTPIMKAMTVSLPCRAHSGLHAGIARWARSRLREFPISPPDPSPASGRGEVPESLARLSTSPSSIRTPKTRLG
jgi:hypothetical protein